MRQTEKVRITLFKSLIGVKQRHRACVRGLGLRYRGHTIELSDTVAVRGMIRKVSYLVSVGSSEQSL